MIGILLIVVTVLVSWKGLRDQSFFDKYHFNTDRVLISKEYYRLLTAGFLHTSWPHLIWNMVSLYAFSETLELQIGSGQFVLIYFTSMTGGHLMALFIHKNHGDYGSAGASGAVAGIIFAAIALFPGLQIGLFFLPAIQGWIFGLLYVLISIAGIRSKTGNISHEAHLGGAIIGMLTAITLHPAAIRENLTVLLAISIPAAVFLYLLATKSYFLATDRIFQRKEQRYFSIDHRYNAERAVLQKEVDRILEKIGKKGMGSLTKKEKETLEQHSKTLR